jgi:hypothetical protein
LLFVEAFELGAHARVVRSKREEALEISDGAIRVGREVFGGLGRFGEQLGALRFFDGAADRVVVESE